MADNVSVTPGTGAVVAADNCTVNAVPNVFVPLGKLGFGANDVFSYVTSAAGLPANVVQVGGTAFALGQALAAASLPVVLTAAQVTALTPPSSVGITGTVAATQSGTWNVGTVTTVTTVAAVTAISNALPAGTNNIGFVSLAPSTTGGLSTYSLVSAATANATNVKASAGQLYGYSIFNTTSTAVYVKLYNSASAPTAGSGTPVRRLMIPANGGLERTLENGLTFSTGIGFTTVTGSADSSSTAVGVGDVLVNLDYK